MLAALFSRRKPARATRRLELETLEARELLNADLGPLTDPATVYGTQQVTGVLAPDMAIDGNGERFVLAWTDQVGPNQYHVRARVMDAAGAFLTDVITVTTDPLPALLNRSPRIDVAMDEQGRFAVAYDGKPFAAGLADIGIQRYDATGTPYGSVYTIGTSNRLDINPNIDLADDGRILVAYDQATSNLLTQRFNFILYASFENLGSNTQISISSTGGEIYPNAVFNADGAALVSATTLTTQATTSIRLVGPNANLSSATVLPSNVLVPPLLVDVPDASDWRILSLYSVSGEQRLYMYTVTVGASYSVAPVVGVPVELKIDASTTTAFAAAADANGNLAVAYQSNAGGTTQLLVAFLDATGNLLEPPTVVGSAAANYAIASGSSVFGALAAYSVQTGPNGTAGDAVAFEIHGYLFGTAAAVVEAPPALILALSPLDNNRELAIYNEQNANKLIGNIVFSGYSTGSIEDIAEGISGQSGASVTETDLDKLFASMRCSDNGGSDEPDTELPLPEMTEDAVPADSELPQ